MQAVSKPPATGDRVTVLYISGIGRSGSTLLNDLVSQHKDVVSVGEVTRLLDRGLVDNQLCGCGQHFSDCSLWTDVGEILGGWENVDAAELLRQKDKIDRNRHSLKLLFPDIAPGTEEPMREFGEWHGRMLVAVRDAANVPLVIDSTKAISTALLLRHLDFVDLRMIHLVRDARGVAYSWTKTQKKSDDGDDRLMDQYKPTAMARRWLGWNSVFSSFAKLGVPVLTVRYEDVVANPRQVVEDVLKFGGVEPTEIDFVDGNKINLEPTHSVAGNPSRFRTGEMELRPDEAWRTKLDEKLRKQVTAITYPLLRKYGYL